MVLVDTSVWADHFCSGDTRLESLLEQEEVVCHPHVIGELACGNLSNRKEILSLLQSLPQTDVARQEEILHFIEIHRLMGIDLGLVDVHLLASARISRLPIWTKDRLLKTAAERLDLNFQL
ncbi:MAG: PIN domain-containing protein [Candidatus Aminicenantales bacterium]